MSENKTKPILVKQPYGYTKRFLQNRITTYENRIMIKILEKVRHLQFIQKEPHLTRFKDREFYFDASDLVTHNNVDKLEAVLVKLRERTIYIPSHLDDKKSLIGTSIFHSFERKIKDLGENRGKVLLIMTDKMYQFILNLSHGYTAFLSTTGFNLSNSYAIKIYYHICHWFKLFQKTSNQNLKRKEDLQHLGNDMMKPYKCKTYFSIGDFKKEFLVSDTYKPADIKRKILHPAKKELDEKAEVSFNYTEKKEGRKIVGFSFVFYRNTSNFFADNHKKLTLKEQNFLIALSIEEHLSKPQKLRFTGLIRKYGIETIEVIRCSRHKEIKKYMATKKIGYVEALGYVLEGEWQKENKDTHKTIEPPISTTQSCRK